MRTSPVNYVLTTYSATMFGTAASIHQKEVTLDEAKALIGPSTTLIATRKSHENMAKRVFGDLAVERFADMHPEKSAILLHYRGVPLSDEGTVPADATVTLYLIESEEYLDEEE